MRVSRVGLRTTERPRQQDEARPALFSQELSMFGSEVPTRKIAAA
jgi:hypothetical protein